MNRFFAALIVSLGLGWCCSSSDGEDAIPQRFFRVAVLADQELAGEEVTALETINGTPGFASIERSQLNQILSEKSLREAHADQIAGRLLAADFIVRLSRDKQGEARMEMIGAQDSRLLQSEKYTPDSLRAALELVRKTPVPSPVRVAILETPGARSQEGAAALREFLLSAGVTVLDRYVVQHVATEHGLAENGFTDTDAEKIAPILGADALVLAGGDDHTLSLSVLAPKSGALHATERFPWLPTTEPSEAARSWLVSHLDLKDVPPEDYFPEIQIEALKPFYEGIAKYRNGQPVDALLSFQEAYNLNDKFYETLLWEAQCYEAIGLPHMAFAIRRYADRCLVGRGISAPLARGAVDGLCFLGVTCADPTEALSLNQAALRAIQQVSHERILLPEHLAAWQEEYDALSRVERTDGVGWARAPRYFVQRSVHGTMEADGAISWSLMDNVSGQWLARETTPPVPESKLAEELKGTMGKLLAGKSDVTSGPPVAPTLIWPKDRNLDILHKVAETPQDKSLWGAKLKINGSDYSGLEAFLNFGLSDELIARLPPDSPHRLWLELLRINSFLPFEPRGRLLSGENPDPVQELEKFAQAHAMTPSGAAAAYMYEFETLSRRSFPEIVERWNRLIETIKSVPDFQPSRMKEGLLGMAGHVRDLALIAQGKTDGFSYLPKTNFPRRLELSIAGPQIVNFQGYHYFDAGEWRFLTIPKENWPQEAAVALRVMYSRPTTSKVIDPKWLEEYPNSFCLLDFAIRSLFDVDHADGLPMRNPFNPRQERANFRRTLSFCEEKLLQHLGSMQNVTQFDYICGMCRRLIVGMHQYQFANEISDGEYFDMQAKVAAALDATGDRLGLSVRNDWCGDYWRHMPRWYDPTKVADDWYMVDNAQDPAKALDREASAGRQAFAASPARDKSWTNIMKSGELRDWTTVEQRAEIAAKYLGDMERLYGTGPLSPAEMEFILDYARILRDGGHTPEAEHWFRRVQEQPMSDLVRFGKGRQLILLGKFNLALMLQRDKRERDTLNLAHEVVAESGDRTVGESTPVPNGLDSLNDPRNIRTRALRLLRNMRLSDLAKGKENLRVITLEIPESAQNIVRFYFRLPAGYATQKKPAKILVIMPSWTHSAPDYCFGTNTWTRFCDAMGWVLCGPDFEEYLDNEGHPYRHPEGWSGKALLNAVDELAKKESVDARKLLLHGYGAGGQFVTYFARYAPERVQAVSAHGCGGVAGQDYLPRLKSLGQIKDIPFLVTIGDEDDKRQEYWDRRALAISMVTNMEGAGIKVIWRAWPGVGHWPTPEMEKLAQIFLGEAARPGGLPAHEEFVGNRATGEYFGAKDDKARSIPKGYQQPLPDRELAEAWRGK